MIPLTIARDKFVEYLKTKGRADATVIAYSKDIQQLVDYLKNNKGKAMAHEATRQDIEDFLLYLSENSYTKKTISRKINAIKTFFKYLMDIGEVTTDPAQLIQHPKLEQSAPRILSKIEYRALRDTVKEDVRTRAIIEVLLQTGVRVSELANIRIPHVSFGQNNEQGTLEIPGTRSVPGRTIPLNKAVQEAIQDYLKIRPESKTDHLFITKTGNPLLIRNIRATLTRYFNQIGLENVTVNDLRHTFVAEHLKRGASVLLVSKIAGHKRLTTTENYLKYIERQESGVTELEEL